MSQEVLMKKRKTELDVLTMTRNSKSRKLIKKIIKTNKS
jgi:hypothetical protein